MVLQWLLMPVIAIVYSSMASYNAQTRLLIGKYLDKFDVTEKTTVEMNDQNRVQDKKEGLPRFFWREMISLCWAAYCRAAI